MHFSAYFPQTAVDRWQKENRVCEQQIKASDTITRTMVEVVIIIITVSVLVIIFIEFWLRSKHCFTCPLTEPVRQGSVTIP